MRKLYALVLLGAVGVVPAAVAQELPIRFIDATETHLPEVVKKALNSMDARPADLDGDGDLDLVIAMEFVKNVILINDGSGKFSDGSSRLPDLAAPLSPKPYPYYPNGDTEDVAIADFDGDGDLDLFFVAEDNQTNEFYLNDGTGTFTEATDRIPVTGTSNAVIAHDFDGDGLPDVIIGNRGQNVYLRNKGGAHFIEETNSRLPLRSDITQDLEAHDFDGDGDLDLIVGNEQENYLLRNNGKGIFTDVTSSFISAEHQASGETREADFADIDGDGQADLYFANVMMFQQQAPIQRMLLRRGQSFVDETRERLGFTDAHSCIDADFVDIDGDGDLDLLLATYERPLLYLNGGKGYFTDATETAFPNIAAMGVDLEVADYNGDGLLDVYLANFRGTDRLLLQQPGE